MPTKKAARTKKQRILIVEDDEGVRALEAVTLELAGYNVTEAATGEEGLEALRKRSFDLVLLDLMMPGIDGYEVLKRLREMPNRSGIPVIIVTARGREQQGLLREAAGGVDDHIDKPFTPATLQKAVATVLTKTPRELEDSRSSQSRVAGVYEAVLHLRTAAGSRDQPEVRLGLLRRTRR